VTVCIEPDIVVKGRQVLSA